MAEFDYVEIEKRIEYVFKNKDLLKCCFTHSSYAYEHRIKNNEKLEFLGDSILNFIIAEEVCKRYKDQFREGVLSKVRAKIVSTESLVSVCEKYGLNKFVLYTVDKQALINKRKLFADVLEALIAGIYLDGGMDNAKIFVLNIFADSLDFDSPNYVESEDSKTALQELVQHNKYGEVRYELLDKSGSDHVPIFKFAVFIGDKNFGEGVGYSKKEAQRIAAKEAIIKLKGLKQIETEKN